MTRYAYKTTGTCSREITFGIENGKVHDVVFDGGCPGNLQAIPKLIEGKDAAAGQRGADRLTGRIRLRSGPCYAVRSVFVFAKIRSVLQYTPHRAAADAQPLGRTGLIHALFAIHRTHDVPFDLAERPTEIKACGPLSPGGGGSFFRGELSSHFLLRNIGGV